MDALRVSIVTNAKEDTRAYTDSIFPPGMKVLLHTEQELLHDIENVDVLIPGHINVGADLIGRGKSLKLIHCGTGYNNVDLDAASKQGAYVAVTPNVAAQSVAELVFASVLTLLKKIHTMDAAMKAGGWKSTDFIDVPELKGKIFGIVGYGNIGKAAARIARGFGMTIIAHDPNVKIDEPDVKSTSLDELLKTADVITLHVLLNAQTKGLIGKPQLDLMKKTAILVNACRGPVVQEPALIDALTARTIGGACLDVYEKEPLAKESGLRKLDNIILTPHIAYCANEALAARYQFFADNCQLLASGKVPQMAVNADKVSAMNADRKVTASP
jgi:D-3-phosphoglycerate dehydrogenase